MGCPRNRKGSSRLVGTRETCRRNFFVSEEQGYGKEEEAYHLLTPLHFQPLLQHIAPSLQNPQPGSAFNLLQLQRLRYTILHHNSLRCRYFGGPLSIFLYGG